MEDGYYLSAYVHIGALAHLYEVVMRHDQTIALWKKTGKTIRLVRYWELERKSGLKKHSLSFYSYKQCVDVINMLLKEENITFEDVVDVWGTPGLEKKGLSSSYDIEMACPLHSLCHLFSGMMSKSEMFYNDKVLAFALDGGPDNVIDINAREKEFYWGAYCNHGDVKYFSVPSPGAFWSLLKIHYNMEEGSLMALGSATTSKLLNENLYLKKIPDVYKGKDFDLAYEWIESIIEDVEKLPKTMISDYDERFSEQENRISIVVKIIQNASMEMIANVVKNVINEYDIIPEQTYLSMTGGFALNCPSNSFLMNRFMFKGFETCPCVSDSGIALGLGLYEFYTRMETIDFELGDSYYGSIDKRNVCDLNNSEWKKYIEEITFFSAEQFATDIQDEVLVWFYGAAEIGPRALGARSILGNPNRVETKEVLNIIKQRQWWRPVAPIILCEEQNKWFDNSFESPYMLSTSYVVETKRNDLTAALHLDFSARIQSLKKENNKLLYEGIQEFYKKTGIPVICNTSLNDKGEPIVDIFEEALNFALRKGIRLLYLNGYRVVLRKHEEYSEKNPLRRQEKMFLLDCEEVEKACAKYNPEGLTKEQIAMYLHMSELSCYDIQNSEEVKKLKRIMKYIRKLRKSVSDVAFL